MPESYDRIIKAALAETRDKFALAEALALDIPPRRRGPTGDDEESVTLHLAAARERIITAGGEPKSIETLARYRKTALWVSVGDHRNFRWLPGYSLTAHDEARAAGRTIADFTARPTTSRETRHEAGKAFPGNGPPEQMIPSWSPEQKATAFKQLSTDPTVMHQPEVQEAIVEAAAQSPRLATQVNARASELRPTPLAPSSSDSSIGLELPALLGVGAASLMGARRDGERVSDLVSWLRGHRLNGVEEAAVEETVGSLRQAAEMYRRFAGEIELALGVKGSTR